MLDPKAPCTREHTMKTTAAAPIKPKLVPSDFLTLASVVDGFSAESLILTCSISPHGHLSAVADRAGWIHGSCKRRCSSGLVTVGKAGSAWVRGWGRGLPMMEVPPPAIWKTSTCPALHSAS